MSCYNAQHYASVKSICDFLWAQDKNSNYQEIYKQWGEMSTEEQVIELEYLETILNESIENEEDKIWKSNFKSALATVMKIQEELIGGIKNV